MNSTSEHILLIDDDPDMHEALKMILEPEGFRLTCCLTGPLGLEAMRRDPPGLILLDVMLTTPSEGFHLAYQIKNDDRFKEIPVIMISAIGRTMEMDFASELGSDYLPAEKFINKPFEASLVLTAVRDALAESDRRHVR